MPHTDTISKPVHQAPAQENALVFLTRLIGISHGRRRTALVRLVKQLEASL